MSDSADELVYANGIDATTGGYLLPGIGHSYEFGRAG